MRVAEINVNVGRFHTQKTIGAAFDNIEDAEREYRRIVDLLEKRGSRENDVPKNIEIKGITEVSFNLDDLVSVGLADFAKINSSLVGLSDTFPLMFK